MGDLTTLGSKNILLDLYHHAKSFFSSESGKTILKWAERLLIVGIIALLVYQLWDTDKDKLINALPLNPLFYLLATFQFLVVPVSEYFIYQLKWEFKGIDYFKGFLTKKVYNNELYNYTGELYFSGWIAKKLAISTKSAALFVKDNNIASSLASTLFAFATLIVLSSMGYFDLLNLVTGFDSLYIVLIVVFAFILTIVAYRFRNKLVHSSRSLFAKLFSVYVLRFIIRHFLLVLMWSLAAPSVSVATWLNFLTVKILLDRLPIGNQSLILLGMAPWLSSTFNLGIEIFTGIQLVLTIFDKILSGITLVWAKSRLEPKNNG